MRLLKNTSPMKSGLLKSWGSRLSYKPMGWLASAIQYVCFFALFCIASLWVAKMEERQWEAVWSYRYFFFVGWQTTILLSLASLGLSFVVGVVAALLRRSKVPLFAVLSQLYVELVRGTPLLVQILFFFYVVAYHVGLDNRYVAGVLILSLFHGAYIAEMVRGGLDNISRQQQESARAIGLSKMQAYRYVILPQAFRLVIPPLAGQFASIIKDSSLLSVIGINEVTNTAQQINSATYSTLESFLPLAIAYLVLTLPISLLSSKLEKKFQYEA